MEIIVVRSRRMGPKVRRRVEERRAKGICIKCGEAPIAKRECCTRCHSRFLTNRPKSKVDQAKYEAQCIERGLIGVSRQGQRNDVNEYRDLSAEVAS
jgi:hypothetical protein